jgi:hypothetical protein
VRVEERDLEVKRKKDKDEIQRMRDEEMLKIKKEKKVLEQRAKNLQFSNMNKKSSMAGSLDSDVLRKKLE